MIALQMAPRSADWASFRYLTCSVLPVARACNCTCSFCFSRSSLSALPRRAHTPDVERYYRFARARGATRLVVTGGGEPLLRPELCLEWIRLGARCFDEIALFTNGARLTRELADALRDAGLSYLCYSRHHHDDARNAELMGEDAPSLDAFFEAAGDLRVRATCVMCRGFIDDAGSAEAYAETLASHGVRELTFKHTYVAYDRSVFRDSPQDQWAREHAVDADPFEGRGTIVARLPWGPAIRRLGELQICHYTEPTPAWERQHRLGRSLNLMADGTIYGSLEDAQSRVSLPPS